MASLHGYLGQQSTPISSTGAAHPLTRSPELSDDSAFEIVHDTRNHVTLPLLTVDEIAKMANSGVKIDWADVAIQVRPNHKPQPQEIRANMPLVALGSLLTRRYLDAQNMTSYGDETCHFLPFQCAASILDATVYVMVHVSGKKPVLLEDNVALYPSDALMIKLNMYLDEKVNPV